MRLTRTALAFILASVPIVAQEWFGTWRLHTSTDPGDDPQKRPQTLVIGETGWVLARINQEGNPSAIAVRNTDGDCILIGAPSSYTCSQSTEGDRSEFRLLNSGKEIEALDAVISPDGKNMKVRTKRGSNEYEAVWVRVPDRPAQ
jgi:hypothetical protein